jgi:hypothetical protein
MWTSATRKLHTPAPPRKTIDMGDLGQRSDKLHIALLLTFYLFFASVLTIAADYLVHTGGSIYGS